MQKIKIHVLFDTMVIPNTIQEKQTNDI